MKTKFEKKKISNFLAYFSAYSVRPFGGYMEHIYECLVSNVLFYYIDINPQVAD